MATNEVKAQALDERFDMRTTTGRMQRHTTALLNTLSSEQLARARFDFPSEAERRDWDFIPKYRSKGLPLRDMNSHQQGLAQELIAVGLSVEGYTKAVAIMAHENVLRETQKERMGLAASNFRHSGNYFFSFFGEPNMEMTWGWRIVGHHLSLNYTIVDGFCLAHTPHLMGAEPAKLGAFGPLLDDEDRGFDLLYALSPEQRRQAIIHDVAPPDFVSRVVSKLGQEEMPADHELGFDFYIITDQDREALKWIRNEAQGLPASAMNAEQFEKFKGLIEGYVTRMPQEAAEKHMQRLTGLGLQNFCFVWAGKPERGAPHYYRIQGPELLIEFENAQSNGNHIHTLWRDPNNDFGDDLLLQHYAQEHLPGVVSRLQSTVPAGPAR